MHTLLHLVTLMLHVPTLTLFTNHKQQVYTLDKRYLDPRRPSAAKATTVSHTPSHTSLFLPPSHTFRTSFTLL